MYLVFQLMQAKVLPMKNFKDENFIDGKLIVDISNIASLEILYVWYVCMWLAICSLLVICSLVDYLHRNYNG